MALDREAALKRAEKFLRQGKLDSAIEEYVRLIDDQPRDWNAINALGDLYVRAGHAARAVAQFARVGDHLFDEGFFPKASALYKKVLKVQPRHEHTVSRLAEIATRQGLLADAAMYLRQLLDERRTRGDERGVADVLEQLRNLDADSPAPAPAQQAPEPSALLAPDDPGELFALARTQLYAGEELQGRAVLTRALTLDPVRHAEALQLALDLAAAGRVDTAFGCVDVVTDAALLDGEWQRAIDALQTFIDAAPHLPASIKLVELCVDAGLEDHLRMAQAQLTDLLEQEPDSERAPSGLDPGAVFEATEIDLSDALSGIETTTTATVQEDPAAVLQRAIEHMQAGRVEEALADLQDAAAQPRTRARAASELGRLYDARGDIHAAVQWFELAADGPAATQDEAYAVLYDLADALARQGEASRALAILIDLDAEAGDYRDVRTRIEQLAGSRGQ